MKNTLRTPLNVLFCLLFLYCSCGQSSDDNAELLEDDTVPVAELPDVNAPDYWDDAVIVWQDEFDGTELSMEKWRFETGSHGWGNNELQNYVENDNVEVSDGTLKIIAKKEAPGSTGGTYTSTRLNSISDFRYGRLEIRAKIPEHKGNGLWPALWMLGSNIGTVGWPACGEIDIMEYVSFSPNEVHFSIHSTANNHKDGTQVTSGPLELETIEEEFHNYGVLWTNQYLKFYIDDITNVKLTFPRPAVTTAENWPFSQPFYFLMNIAVGGDWGGLEGVDDSIFPAVMEVDYVRVYQVQ
ncbi:glycoside hydrolase family 16 protein [Poritiphilus flavus]|uniref:Family 16 glycosylhydrolase n=1 Tax=Poritiphilus flavus TaxID=2697053 RepID=A0A6L9EEF8_9FLAO|nr:glycoside hydrolase family 16 protein [Poritiphilus flavus]NAS13115.1 family 16 glycosylhydrolase [Poritiphilus flavus]